MKSNPLQKRRFQPGSLTRADLQAILAARTPAEIENVRRQAHAVLLEHCGPEVYYRGLIELSNDCSRDCLYCGIRRSNRELKRYRLSEAELVEAGRWCADQGYGSVVLQAGEQHRPSFIREIAASVRRIKLATIRPTLPEGLGITLCLGEQTRAAYKLLRAAGAHRYLLRIETSNPDLFARLHPREQRWTTRLQCLRWLRAAGFQVGSGVMIGLPGQSIADLAGDIEFFMAEDIDMIGMGPYIPHAGTPLGQAATLSAPERLRLSLLMIAATRLALPDINIAATTALQVLDAEGREKGLHFGANVLMPLLTPGAHRGDYLLYPGKPLQDETALAWRAAFEARLLALGRRIGRDQWGDAPRARK
ncbi:MAG: [FeFe] hydrogenase H-cluster radical SAM maturase HydE, partial [Lentisphaerae bacterium]|nr:[FeFe] hydrogenase H-cluster radical SAM maturase HydE [Lentisphaerota bacterium]